LSVPIIEQLNTNHEASMILEPFSEPGLSPYEEVQRISINLDEKFPLTINISIDPSYQPLPVQDDLTLILEHHAPSIVRYDGKLFGVTNAPFQWVVRKDLKNPQGDGTDMMDRPSPSYESIINLLLSDDKKLLDLVLWEEPAMWTKYFIYVQHTPSWKPLPIIRNITIYIPYNRVTLTNNQECMLRLDTIVDYTTSTIDLKKLSIYKSMENTTILDSYPFISVSPTDLNGRTCGYGPKMFRFFKCNQQITLVAEAMTTSNEFLYWQIYQDGKEINYTQLELSLYLKTPIWAIAHYSMKNVAKI